MSPLKKTVVFHCYVSLPEAIRTEKKGIRDEFPAELKHWPPKAMVASRQHTFIQGNLGHGCCQGVPAAVLVVSGFQNCRWDRDHCGFPYFLSGGNSKIVYFYPDPWGDGPI